MHPNWFLPYLGYASEANGCYNFTASETTNFTVTMWAESRIGGASNITLRAFEDEIDLDNGVVSSWMMLTSPGTSGGTVYLQNTAGEVSNLIAWGTFIVYWIDHFTSPRLNGTKTLNLLHEPCGVGGSCQDGNVVYIDDGAVGIILASNVIGDLPGRPHRARPRRYVVQLVRPFRRGPI